MFNDAEKVQLRKYCGFGAQTAIAFNRQEDLGTLNIILDGLTADEEAEVRVNYLSRLPDLEQALFDMSENLDTAIAAVWTHNQNELSDRRSLYNQWRLDLCAYLGAPVGPSLASARGGNQGRIIRG